MKDIEKLTDEHIEDVYKRIGLNVKNARKEKGVSQLQLSQAIGHKSVTMISHCEIYLRNHHFNIEHLVKIAYVLDIELNDLLK